MSSSKLGVSSGTKRALAPPSPSPSNASNTSHGTPSKRVKREKEGLNDTTLMPTPAAAAAAQVNFGNEHMTQLIFAKDYLKSKGVPKTLQDVLNHLSKQHLPEKEKIYFANLMKNHTQIRYTKDPKNPKDSKAGTFQFVAKIPGVKSKETLLDYLQRKTDASKLDVKELKDGWPDCDKAIEELEAEHKLLVVRTKKDNHAKFVWIDTPQLFHAVDPEFLQMWQKVELPSLDDIVRKLTAVGQKPASADPRLLKKETTKQVKQKRRVNRSNKRQTNVHMQHLLKDYSNLRRG